MWCLCVFFFFLSFLFSQHCCPKKKLKKKVKAIEMIHSELAVQAMKKDSNEKNDGLPFILSERVKERSSRWVCPSGLYTQYR